MKKQMRHPLRASRTDVIQLKPQDGKTKAGKASMDWSWLLVAFMRTVACLWILRGLLLWSDILRFEATPFETESTRVALLIVAFAVADLIAAVGLWIATAWGGVLWIFTAIANIVVTLAVPRFNNGGKLTLVVDIALIAAYFVLTWYAAQDSDE